MKKISIILALFLILAPFAGCAEKKADDFRGMYDEEYDRGQLDNWEIKDGILYGFEKDRNLFETMTVENFEGNIDYNEDSQYISTGAASMKSTLKNSAMSSSVTVKYKFGTGKNGQDITDLTKITLDVYNPNDYKMSLQGVITSSYASYYFGVQEIAANGMTEAAMELTHELKDYLGEMSGFSLSEVLRLEYRLTIPQGAQGDKVVYFDDLRYHGGDENYTPPPAAEPFVREDGEVNNFNDENRCRFVTPEYEIGLAGYDNQNQYVSADFEEEIKHEGAGSLKFTNRGLELGEYDAGTYGYPALSLRREEQIGTTNLTKYNTLSFWIYYDAQEGSGGLAKNPDTIKFVFEFRNNYFPNGPEIVPDLVIPKHTWVNIKINLADDIFALRDYTTALRFWTYGFNTAEMDRIVYFDDISLSEEQLSAEELGGKKYVIYTE